MQDVAAIATLVAGIAAALYVTWRTGYRYPPPDIPQALCFHKVSRRFLWEGTWTTPRRFFDTIDHLRDRGYRFVDESDYLAALDRWIVTGEGTHGRDLFLTFDDGYAGLVEEVLDGLVERSVPMHVFLVSDYVGRANDWDLGLGRPSARHASWDEIGRMAQAGATFGSHTATHRDLTRISRADLVDELERSRREIEDALGTRVRTLSYPFGRYNESACREAAAAGYDAAFSLYPRHPNDTVERYALRRNGVYVIDTPAMVEARLRPGPLFWFEEMKCRAINAVAALTPLLKR